MIAKRVSLSMLAIGVTSLLVSAASFALFSANTTNTNNTFTTGTVTLGAPATSITNIDNIAPGDSGSYTYTVQYTGSLDAWLGLTSTLTGPLTTCDAGGKFTVGITSGAKTFSPNAPNQVMAVYHTNDTATLNVTWGLNLSAGNDCQAKSATLTLMVKAVQSRNNTNGGGTGPNAWN